jgi:hypothetical protein
VTVNSALGFGDLLGDDTAATPPTPKPLGRSCGAGRRSKRGRISHWKGRRLRTARLARSSPSCRSADGRDYLVCRKLSSLWHELTDSCLQPDLDRFISAALELGFTPRVASAIGSQIIARLLIQTGRPLSDLCESALQELLNACDVRHRRTGRGAKHYRSTTYSVPSSSAWPTFRRRCAPRSWRT